MAINRRGLRSELQGRTEMSLMETKVIVSYYRKGRELVGKRKGGKTAVKYMDKVRTYCRDGKKHRGSIE